MGDPVPTRRYQISLMLFLVALNFASFFDRSLTGIMGESIKRDLKLTDTELGLSLGVAFTVFTSLLALPIARAADRGHRKLVIMASIVGWSTMTFLAGYAQNLWQLAATRIGVAIGEAGIVPSSHALISLKFSPAKTAFLISILGFGAYLGMAAAPALGGWVDGLIGWRRTFMLFGPMSLLLLPVVYFVLRDPPSSENEPVGAAVQDDEQIRSGSVLQLIRQPTFALLLVGGSLIYVGASAYLVYAGPFLIRTFGVSTAEAGRDLGIAFGVPPLCAALLGGWMFDRFKVFSWALALGVPACGCALSALVAISGWMSGSAVTTTICLAISTALFGISTGPGFATAQLLAPPGMKSTASAVFNLGLGIVGGTIGPLVAGGLSDALHPTFGNDSLRYGLSAASFIAFIGAGFMLAAGFSLKRAMANPLAPPAMSNLVFKSS